MEPSHRGGRRAYAAEARALIDALAERGRLTPEEATRARDRLAEDDVATALDFAFERADIGGH